MKLIIGTRTSNVLATSSIRLDTKEDPLVGCINLGFRLTTVKDSIATKIFVDQECLDTSVAMAANAGTDRISDTNILYQLRQLRSKFDHPSAYTLCRASGPLTDVHVCQPFTTFTLADYDKGRYPVANLFRLIGILVLKHGQAAMLPKSSVQDVIQQSTGKIQIVLQSMLSLYPLDDDSSINILMNSDLNQLLQRLGELIMPAIVSANVTVQKQIANVFQV
ncbi:hypothetical protein CLU79DRAFT_781628 [Phycomyces nitens]|nr:hypothetical protein CLU79DRAFT_781628 [Phycomyces nitens]